MAFLSPAGILELIIAAPCLYYGIRRVKSAKSGESRESSKGTKEVGLSDVQIAYGKMGETKVTETKEKTAEKPD